MTLKDLDRRVMELERRVPSGPAYSQQAGGAVVRPYQVGLPVETTAAWTSTEGYAWRALVLDTSLTSGQVKSSTALPTGKHAHTPDNVTTLEVGTRGWLEVDPQARGWLFVPAQTTAAPAVRYAPWRQGFAPFPNISAYVHGITLAGPRYWRVTVDMHGDVAITTPTTGLIATITMLVFHPSLPSDSSKVFAIAHSGSTPIDYGAISATFIVDSTLTGGTQFCVGFIVATNLAGSAQVAQGSARCQIHAEPVGAPQYAQILCYAGSGSGSGSGDPAPDPDPSMGYDCVEGACVEAVDGAYATLGECQDACGGGATTTATTIATRADTSGNGYAGVDDVELASGEVLVVYVAQNKTDTGLREVTLGGSSADGLILNGLDDPSISDKLNVYGAVFVGPRAASDLVINGAYLGGILLAVIRKFTNYGGGQDNNIFGTNNGASSAPSVTSIGSSSVSPDLMLVAAMARNGSAPSGTWSNSFGDEVSVTGTYGGETFKLTTAHRVVNALSVMPSPTYASGTANNWVAGIGALLLDDH